MMIEIELKKILPAERIRTKYIDVVSFSADAGFYELIPKAVVQPINENEVIALFQFSHSYRIPLVFRTGGTSLSGQSITDGILVDLSQYWSKTVIEQNGNLVRVQPGITGAMVNAQLKKYQRKIGPDPSSINAAMMGGILSNNSSGMCCGVSQNSYHTTKHIRFVLPDGKIFSTEQKDDYYRFEIECYELFKNLGDLRHQILTNDTLNNRIRKKYETKNTVGYSLNAFIDFEHPLDILAHLLIGAEGTLAFISEAVLNTLPDYAFKSTSLIYFPTMFDACAAIIPLTNAGALMVELMDRASLRAIEMMEGMPAVVKTLSDTAAALLIEFQEETKEALDERVKNFLAGASTINVVEKPVFTNNPVEQAFLWKVRKGLFPAVGAVRASGTTVILEDVGFPVDRLGQAIVDLQQLFKKYKYDNAIIFGHAKDGNIHFVITQALNSAEEISRYDLFLRDVVTLVINKYGGTLKAEHGTGRNMAPFVETEWGGDAYRIMKKIKEAIDPSGLLNPGVIINHDAEAHLKNFKELPSVEQEVDRCIECGYCEHKCPSRDITATPRRRIVIRRKLKQLQNTNDNANYDLLLNQYQYEGLETCAVDGLCATACPVDINTGDLVKRLRRENHSSFSNAIAVAVAKNFRTAQWAVRTALILGTVINQFVGKRSMNRLTKFTRRVIPTMPLWSDQLQAPPSLSWIDKHRKLTNKTTDKSIVYFPSCISRMLGTYEGKQKNIMETFLSVCEKASINVMIPQQINSACCSQMFSSKGYSDAHAFMGNDIIEKLWIASREGKYPVVMDVSSCSYSLLNLKPVLTAGNKAKFDKLSIIDSVDFLLTSVTPSLKVSRKKKLVTIHPVCSLEKMKSNDRFVKLAQHYAEEVFVPLNAGCCGMAGDRGFLFPELTASATRQEASDVKSRKFDGYYSTTKTCEMAMTSAVKENYESVLYMVDECSE